MAAGEHPAPGSIGRAPRVRPRQTAVAAGTLQAGSARLECAAGMRGPRTSRPPPRRTVPRDLARAGVVSPVRSWCCRVAASQDLDSEPDIGLRAGAAVIIDRKSTRLNSSHLGISYAVFCLKKKKKN